MVGIIVFLSDIDMIVDKKRHLSHVERILDPRTEKKIQKEVEKLLEYIVEHQVDSVIFLDISTRPIAYIFRRMWDNRYQHQSSATQPKKPDISFINIGRELMVDEPPQDGEQPANAYLLLREAVRDQGRSKRWRSNQLPIMSSETVLAAEAEAGITNLPSFTQKVHEAQSIYGTKFDGKSVLLVDETLDTGTSIAYGMAILQHAFPDMTSIEGCWLMAGEASLFRKGIGVTDNPHMLAQLTQAHLDTVQNQSELLARSIGSTKTRTEYQETINTVVRNKPECIHHIEALRDNVQLLESAVKKFEQVIAYVSQHITDHPRNRVSRELSEILEKNMFFDYTNDIQKVKQAVDFFMTTDLHIDRLTEPDILAAYRYVNFAYDGIRGIDLTMKNILNAMGDRKKPDYLEDAALAIEQEERFIHGNFDKEMSAIIDLFDNHLNDDVIQARIRNVRQNLQFIADI